MRMEKKILKQLEEYLNNQILKSATANNFIFELGHKALLIKVDIIDIEIFLIVDDNQIFVKNSFDGITHATLSGSPTSLLSFLRSKGQKSDRVSIEGDARVLDDIYTLLNLIKPDFAFYLSEVFGDLFSYHSIELINNTIDFRRKTHNKLILNIRDFLQEENKSLPTMIEANKFFDEVDLLRDDAERVILEFKDHFMKEQY